MAVRLRLTRVGKKKQPTYRIVAADRRSPRDGRFIEIIGTYNPRAEPSAIKVDNTAALKWLKNGAQPSERVKKLLELSGAWAAHTTGADAPEMFEVPEPTAAPEPTSEPVSAVAYAPAFGDSWTVLTSPTQCRLRSTPMGTPHRSTSRSPKATSAG